MSTTGLQYASVYASTVSVGVWSQAGDKWFNFATSGWETPFDSAKHLLVTTSSAAFSTLRGANIPDLALTPDSVVVEFAGSGANATPTSTICAPQNYASTFPIRGSLSFF